MSDDPPATRRIELTLTRPWFALYAGIRPTVVVAGRGHPVQWGVGTWQLPADGAAAIGVFLFNRVWRFGESELVVRPEDPPAIAYRAPALPFGRGQLRVTAPRRD
ncbi:hypothetical protein HQM25_03630 [Microbacterium hominis]|uniref:Uncharacterized protein n=1 Tax=Microbacterium hominis TaxID=162426 RepID=A0A7D4PW44_9MICO|nr:hypothetical protein HQM25_03630 [Microbacterium hominis]